jgi:hypothetical protein
MRRSAAMGIVVGGLAFTMTAASASHKPSITPTMATFTIPAGPQATWTLNLWSQGVRLGTATGSTGVLTVPVPSGTNCRFQADARRNDLFFAGAVATFATCGPPPTTTTTTTSTSTTTTTTTTTTPATTTSTIPAPPGTAPSSPPPATASASAAASGAGSSSPGPLAMSGPGPGLRMVALVGVALAGLGLLLLTGDALARPARRLRRLTRATAKSIVGGAYPRRERS